MGIKKENTIYRRTTFFFLGSEFLEQKDAGLCRTSRGRRSKNSSMVLQSQGWFECGIKFTTPLFIQGLLMFIQKVSPPLKVSH